MRFLHSFLYAFVIWFSTVVLGSLISAWCFISLKVEAWQFELQHMNSDAVLPIMLVVSAIFTIPAMVIIFFIILGMNPRRKEKQLNIKLVLTVSTLVLTVISFWVFILLVRYNMEETTLQVDFFIPFPAIYLGVALILIWSYPLRLAVQKTALLTASDQTVAAFKSKEEKEWFQRKKE